MVAEFLSGLSVALGELLMALSFRVLRVAIFAKFDIILYT